jgi:hypothetical protein
MMSAMRMTLTSRSLYPNMSDSFFRFCKPSFSISPSLWLCALLLALSGFGCRAGARQSAAKPPWARTVVVGASASAGFTSSSPLGSPDLRLNHYLDATLVSAHEPVTNLASVAFFLQPDASGETQVARALQAQPTMIVGLDFLFWFCYGQGGEEGARLRHLDQGLKLLEPVHCLLVLGDIPDASGASRQMLSASMIPSAQEIAAANRRLSEWAAARKNVIIVPLSKLMKAVATDQSFTVHGYTLPAGQTRALLQSDGLHPSASGCAMLAVAIMDALVTARPALPAKQIRWDPAEVQRLGMAATNSPAR